jgi:hypothetical protein
MGDSASIAEDGSQIKIDLEAPSAPPENSGLSQDEWDNLTTEEKEGFMDSLTFNPDGEGNQKIETQVLEEIAGEQTPVVEKPAEEKPAEEKPVEAKPAEPAAEKPAEAAPVTQEVVVTDMDLLAYRPTVMAKELEVKVLVPQDVMNAHNEKLAALRTKKEEGEITDAEYETQRDAIKDELSDWKSTERYRLTEEKRDAVVWDKEQEAFLRARPMYLGDPVQGSNKFTKTPKSAALMGALNEAMKTVEAQNPGLPGMQLLIRADRSVREAFGLPMPGGKKEQVKVETKPADTKPPAPKPDLVDLGNLPAAGDNKPGGHWSAVDAFPGDKLEDWLSKQSDAVRDAYLRGN